MDINDEWKMFLSSSDINDNDRKYETQKSERVPAPTPLYISTKTNIAYLKQQKNDSIITEIDNTNTTDNKVEKEINILSLFWDVPVIPYESPTNGILKKQILIKSEKEEDLQKIKDKLLNIKHYNELIITSINNPKGRVKFKDKRKISIGLCKKDITSFRCKQKSAFDNCVVFIMRLNIKGIFKEYHVKLFNTGKVEIPGVKDENIFKIIIENLIVILKPYVDIYLLPTSNNMEVFKYGVRINADVIQDVRCGGVNDRRSIQPWVYFPLLAAQNHPAVQNLNAVKGEFTSTLDTLESPGIQIQGLPPQQRTQADYP